MTLREGQTVHKQDFLDYSYHVPVDSDLLVLSLITVSERNSCYPLAIIMAVRGGGIDSHCALISMPSH